MAAPTFVAASTGSTDATGAWAATCHAPGAAGRIIILQVLQDGATAGAVTFTSATNIENLLGTDNTMTQIPGPYSNGGWAVGSLTSPTAYQYLWIGRSLSTSAPTVAGGNTTAEDTYWRFYEFSGGSVGTTLATVIENLTDRIYAPNHAVATTYPVYGSGGTPSEEYAEPFTPAFNQTVTGIGIWLYKTGTPTDNVHVEIQSDSASQPSGTVVGTGGSRACSTLLTSGPVFYEISASATLTAATQYWVVVRRSGARDTSNYPKVHQSLEIQQGTMSARNSGTWSSTGGDFAYGLLVSGNQAAAKIGATADNVAYDTGIVASDFDRLPLQFVAANDDVAGTAFASTNNLRGGAWSEAVSEYAEPSGTDGMLQLQLATPFVAIQPDTSGALALGIGSGANQMYLGMGFVAGVTATTTQVYVFLGAETGTPTDNLTLHIYSNTPGATDIPNASLGSVTLTDASLTANAYNIFTLAVSLTQSTKYWIVLTRSGAVDAANFRTWRYVAGLAWFEIRADDSTPSTWAFSSAGNWAAYQVVYDDGEIIVHGGSAILAADWGNVGFALLPDTGAPPATGPPRYGFVNHANPGVL